MAHTGLIVSENHVTNFSGVLDGFLILLEIGCSRMSLVVVTIITRLSVIYII